MKRNASRSVPNWLGTWRAATASTAALMSAVDMLGSKIFTFGPKSGIAACLLLDAAAAPLIASAAESRSRAASTRRAAAMSGESLPLAESEDRHLSRLLRVGELEVPAVGPVVE